MLRFPWWGAPRSPAPLPVVDGTPCRPYRSGEHAATMSAMLLRRLVLAALVAAALSLLLPVIVTIATVGGASTTAEVPEVARALGSPIVFALILLVVDYLLVRGRLARALAILTWAGRQSAEDLRRVTGMRRTNDRAAARRWLAGHPETDGEPAEVAAWRVYLLVLTDELAAARSTLARLPRATPLDEVRAGTLEASIDLAAGQAFDAGALRSGVERLGNRDQRATLAVEVGALVAQGRYTCQGDHLSAVLWAAPYVGERSAGVLLRGYWLPIAGLVLVTSVVLSLLFPVG